MKSPQEIIDLMLQNDSFSKWLGIEIITIELGSCQLKTTVRNEMLNGHFLGHGGISYSISDSALAFASNSRGQKAVSIETSIQHIAPVQLDDILYVNCIEIHCGKSVGRYESTVTNQNAELVAKFYGTVYRSSEKW